MIIRNDKTYNKKFIDTKLFFDKKFNLKSGIEFRNFFVKDSCLFDKNRMIKNYLKLLNSDFYVLPMECEIEYKNSIKEHLLLDYISSKDNFYIIDFDKKLLKITLIKNSKIIDTKIIYHNFLNPTKRKELFNDINPIIEFLKKHLNNIDEYMIVGDYGVELKNEIITILDKKPFFVDNFPFIKAYERYKLLKNIKLYIKVNKNFIELKNQFFSYPNKITIKINKEKTINTNIKKGRVKFKYSIDKQYLILKYLDKTIKIELEELI